MTKEEIEKKLIYDKRLKIVFIFFIIVIPVLVGRLFYLQVIKTEYYEKEAAARSQLKEIITPLRGEIFGTGQGILGFAPLAINKKVYNAILSTYNLKEEEKDELIKKIVAILNLDEEEVKKKVEIKNDFYIKLKNNISEREKDDINALKSKYLFIESDFQRSYPMNEVAAKNLGFYGFDIDKRSGKYGLEQFYEQKLKGKEDLLIGQKDALGRVVPISSFQSFQGIDGNTLITSIDINISLKAQEIAQSLVKKWNAQKALVVVSDPQSGQIVASEEYPSYNPNSYNLVSDQRIFLNGLAQESFEPGSIFKPIIAAAALEKKVIEPDSTYNDTGEFKIGKYTIRNSTLKAYGTQTMTQVLEKSLNTGAVYMQKLIGNADFRNFVKKMGFGEKTGIDIAGEIKGNIKNLESDIEVNFATASFGQGITVTPIQIIQAISAIANGGFLIKPSFVKKIKTSDGKELKILKDKKRVISEETANKLSQMLTQVTEQGSGRQAKIKGYYIATKTGTAQIPAPDKKGYTDETIQSAVFFGPVPNPKFLILIKLDRPQGVRFAETSVVPSGGQLMKFLFDYYQIPPNTQ